MAPTMGSYRPSYSVNICSWLLARESHESFHILALSIIWTDWVSGVVHRVLGWTGL